MYNVKNVYFKIINSRDSSKNFIMWYYVYR